MPARRWWGTCTRASTWPKSPKRWRDWRRTHEPAGRAQPGADPVPALVPDPRRAVLALSAPAAPARAEMAGCRRAGAGGAGLRAGDALGPWLGRSRLWPHVAPDRRDRGVLRGVPRCAGRRILVARPLAAALNAR